MALSATPGGSLPDSPAPARELLRAPRDAGAAAEVLRATGLRLEQLDTQVVTAAVERTAEELRTDPNAAERRLDANGQTRMAGLRTTLEANRAALSGPDSFRQPLLRAVSETHRARVEGIISILTAPPPAYGDPVPPELQRYVTYRTGAVRGTQDRWHEYRLNAPHLRADQAYVQTLIDDPAQTEEAKGHLRRLQTMLREFERWDPEPAIGYDMRAGRPASSLDQGAAHLGRLALAAALAGLALITGIMSLANRKFSATPFIYLMLAAVAAKPGVLERTFGPREQREIRESAEALRDNAFNRTCRDKNIRGDDWARVAANTMENKQVTQRALRDVQAGRVDGEAATEYRNSMPERLRPLLRSMMEQQSTDDNGRPTQRTAFAAFAEPLLRVDGVEPRRLVVEYVRAGMWSGANIPGVRLPDAPPGMPVPPITREPALPPV